MRFTSIRYDGDKVFSRDQVLDVRNVGASCLLQGRAPTGRMGPPCQPGSGDVEVIEIELSDDEMTRLPEPKTRLLGDE
jgi:hypothetical protein